MNEELKTMEEQEEANVIVEIYDEPEVPSKRGGGLVAVGLCLAGAAAAVIWHKTKDKRTARQIKKLEKQGYVVSRAEDLYDSEEAACECEDTAEEK